MFCRQLFILTITFTYAKECIYSYETKPEESKYTEQYSIKTDREGHSVRIFSLESIYKDKKNFNYSLSTYIKIAHTLKTVYFVNKIHLFGGCHRNKNINESVKFIRNIRNIFKIYGIKTILHLGNSPDDDFVKMCNSKIFIKAGGGYSRLIANYVFHKKNIVIDPNDY